MPRLTRRLPRLCRHRASGQACVYVDGKVRYLGRWGSTEAKLAYRAFLDERSRGPEPPPAAAPTPAPPPGPVDSPTIAQAMLAFWDWAQRRYRHPDGSPTGEADSLRHALRPLRKLFGHEPIADFGPRKLYELQAAMVGTGVSRRTVNSRIKKVCRFFRWCAGHELIPAAAVDAMYKIEPVAPGMTRETPGRRSPVPWASVEATLPHLPELHRSLVLFLWYTGARVGEALALTTGQLDRSGDVWLARLERHKNAWRGQDRVIPLGPRAIAAIRPWLRDDAPDAAIFDPRRVTARTAVKGGARAPGTRYSRCAPNNAVRRACRAAGIPRWTLAQLRHSRATALRESHGLDVASTVLGHSRPAITAQVYSREAIAHAIDAVRVAG